MSKSAWGGLRRALWQGPGKGEICSKTKEVRGCACICLRESVQSRGIKEDGSGESRPGMLKAHLAVEVGHQLEVHCSDLGDR
jgi:hypothetical protein